MFHKQSLHANDSIVVSMSKLETTPVELAEHHVGVVLSPDILHLLQVTLSVSRERLLPLASIAHVDELGRKSQLLVDLVVVGEEVLGPSGHAEVILGAGPRGSDLPP